MENSQKLVLVIGATGGVGQLVVAKLVAENYQVRVLIRDRKKGEQLFAQQVEIFEGNIFNAQVIKEVSKDVTDIICTVGTTAFPSSKWQLDWSDNNWLENLQAYLKPKQLGKKAKNSPWQVDAEGVINIIENCDRSKLSRFVLVSSCGVLRTTQFPYTILNLFGVLTAKKQGEDCLVNSGIPYTIVRPSRLIDGPFTSYDLNTLFKAQMKNRDTEVVIDTGDKINGQSSRIDVANFCVESLVGEKNINQAFEIITTSKN